MSQQIYSYSSTPTSPLAYSTSSVPIPITNQRKANVYYPSRGNHSRSSSGSFGFTDTSLYATLPDSFRSVRRDSLQGQIGSLVGSYEVSWFNSIINIVI